MLRAYGLRPDLFAVANVLKDASGPRVSYAKGALEAMAELCHLPAARLQGLRQQADAIDDRDRWRRYGYSLTAVGVLCVVLGAVVGSRKDEGAGQVWLVFAALTLGLAISLWMRRNVVRNCARRGSRDSLMVGKVCGYCLGRIAWK